MEFIEKIKDKTFFIYIDKNSITLTEYSLGLKNEEFLVVSVNRGVCKIGLIFSDFIEILFIDENSGNILDKCFYPKSSIKSIWIHYE